MVAQSLVSIILPVYNVQDYLDASLGCAAGQTYENLEIIVVDDGSTDDSLTVARRWAAKDSRIRVVHQENAGLSAARNTGLSLATGDYIYFFDSDDTIECNLVEWCLAAMHNYEADLVMFKFDTISSTGTPLKSNYTHNDYDQVQILTPVEAIKMQLHSDIAAYAWAYMAKASTFRKQNLLFPVGRKIEDLAVIAQIMGESTRIVRLPQVLYHYRQRSGSLMGQIAPSLVIDYSRAVEDREDYILTHYPALKGYLLLQSLSFFSTLDYESIRQSLIFGLKLDPDSIESRAEKRRQEREQRLAAARAKARRSHARRERTRLQGKQRSARRAGKATLTGQQPQAALAATATNAAAAATPKTAKPKVPKLVTGVHKTGKQRRAKLKPVR